ncbi:MAG: ABC transporter permease [Myxococcales bacterium]|nr:ABC transporter permease [Myxococcales bacterium]MDP3500602.1 ABC transporter permease [Myxococcales bacterium]
MHALLEHVRVEWRSALRSPSQLLMAWLFPLGFALVIGGVMPKLNPAFGAQMVAAFALMAVVTGTILGLPGPIVEARAAGVLRGFRVLGVPDAASLGVPGISAALHAIPAALVAALLTRLLFDGEAPTRSLVFVGVVALAAFTFSGLGALIGVVSTSARATVLYSQLIFLPSMLLGGMMVPFAALPANMRPVALLLPTTHVMQLFDGLAYGRATTLAAGSHVGALVVSGLVAWGLALVLFDTEPREVKAWKGVFVLVALLPLAITAALG